MTTLKPKLETRIELMLDEAIELASLGDQHIKARSIAERIYESEKDLMEEVSRLWVVERLTWMITRRRRARWDQELGRGQMMLPDPVFQGLPKTVFLRNGQRPRLMHTVLSETEDHLKLLRERFKNDPRVRQFEAVVELHRKWSAVQRGITLGEAMKHEAQEREQE
jgi:hypothetical protein